MTDFRVLCADLLAWAEKTSAHYYQQPDVLIRARAALAQPEPEVVGPSDEELRELYLATMLDADRDEDDFFAFARAVLARYGHQPAPPAAGEVAELVEGLKLISDGMDALGHESDSWFVARAADLLEQRHPAPVPVASHVYFEFVISDADDCTQAGGIAPTYIQALSEGQHYLAQYQQDGPHTLELRRVEVLNPDALPLPQGEVQP